MGTQILPEMWVADFACGEGRGNPFDYTLHWPLLPWSWHGWPSWLFSSCPSPWYAARTQTNYW